MRIWIIFPLLLIACNNQSNNTKQSPVSNINIFWEEQNSGVQANLRGIFAVDENVVWASGNNGTFLRTMDGGKKWYSDTIAGYTDFDFRDIEAFDSLTALVMGISNPAVILKTTDGGRSWKQVYYKNQVGIFLNSMTFQDQNHGFIVGDPINDRFFLLHSQDGGDTWEEMPEESRPLAKEGEYMFAASGTCIAAPKPGHVWFCSGGSVARIFQSGDDGLNWENVTLPIMSGTPSSGIFSILFPGDKYGYCIGGDYAKPDSTGLSFMFTDDNGQSWQQPESSPNAYRSCLKEIDLDGVQVLVAVGRGGTDFSLDRGQNWKSFGNTGFYTLDVDASGKYAWAAGADGRIASLVIE